VKPAIAIAGVALMSLAACTTTRRVREMEANRDRPVAHLTEVAIRNHEELFPGHASRLKETDPELIEVFDNFAFDEVLGQGDLDVKTRVMVILASTLAESPKDLLHIQELLTANCFGDHVARNGLALKTRELLTFSMLAALGGCEPQLAGHVAANLAVGNDR
jgi:alkylhydroperoxidase/carboxymuconolactone decarboxylase family protein YurZ